MTYHPALPRRAILNPAHLRWATGGYVAQTGLVAVSDHCSRLPASVLRSWAPRSGGGPLSNGVIRVEAPAYDGTRSRVIRGLL